MKKIILLLVSLCTINLYAQDEEAETVKSAYYSNGFKMRIDRITFGFNTIYDWDEKGRFLNFTNGLSLNFGYQYNKHLYYGIGTEIRAKLDFWFTTLSLPIYADLQLSVSDKRVSPYFGLKFGGCVSLRGDCNAYYNLYQREDGKWFHEDFSNKDEQKGLYIHPEIGVRFRIVGIGIGMQFVESVRESIIYNSQFQTIEKERHKSFDVGGNLILSFRIGL